MRRLVLRATVAVLAGVAALATGTQAFAIVGAAQDGGPASLVMILSRSGSRAGFCSGVVVAPRTVLTAAHCVSDATDTRVHVKDRAGAPVLLEVARVVRHPDYQPDAIRKRLRSVDLAVVTTATDLPADRTIARLGSASATLPARFTLAGFGLAREGEPRSGGLLREASVALRTPVSRLLLWLAGEGGACTGDSGGGVFTADGTLVGIIAFAEGTGSAHCGALTQAVRVAPFLEWIEGATR